MLQDYFLIGRKGINMRITRYFAVFHQSHTEKVLIYFPWLELNSLPACRMFVLSTVCSASWTQIEFEVMLTCCWTRQMSQEISNFTSFYVPHSTSTTPA